MMPMTAIASMKNRIALLCVLVAIAVTMSLRSQAATERLLLRGGTVHTVSGETLSPGEVLIEGEKIVEVAARVNAADAKIIELPQGHHVYPGLIAANTTLGLLEIGAVRATRDTTEVGQYTPDVQSWIAVNPDSELIPVARANGITHAQPVPSGATVSGQSGLIALTGWTTEQMTRKKPVALHLAWPDMGLDTRPKEEVRDKSAWKSLEDQAKERRARLKEIDDFFWEAKAYARARERNGSASIVPAWEAMLPFVRGQIPLMVRADEVREIKAAVKWAETNEYKIIIVGGRDAAQAADLLAAKKIPVVYESFFSMPPHESSGYDAQFRTPALLHKAGVKVVLSEGGRNNDATSLRNLPYTAAQAVAFGMPAGEALKAITLHPAEILGVSDRLGSLEAGKEASLFVADGDILDIRANVRRMWIGGEEVSLESRHTRLYERYHQRPRAN